MLTPNAHPKAGALLAAAGGESFIVASDWADRIRRDRPETASWHFVDVEVGSGSYNEARDCLARACVVAKIEDFRAELADARLEPERRGEALKWLIQLIGDMHQPLHAGDRHDRGGNDQRVILDGREHRLHGIWDIDLVKLVRGPHSDTAYAVRLARTIDAAERSSWSTGSPVDWANEAHGLAERVAYGALPAEAVPTVGPEYERAAGQAVELQLRRAGVRLAAVLNAALR
jgi:hypothetical protein